MTILYRKQKELMMKLKLMIAGTVATLACSIALAGFVQPAPVTFDFFEGGGTASGDMRTAREAKNDVDFIGCGVRQFDNGVSQSTFGFCQAQNAEVESITCFTDRPALLETMRATADNSFITFSWVDVDDGEGGLTQECIRVGFSTQSFYLPKK